MRTGRVRMALLLFTLIGCFLVGICNGLATLNVTTDRVGFTKGERQLQQRLSLPATFFPRTDGKGTPLSANTLLGTIGSLPSRYLITFVMLINSDGGSWRNVIHLSANNQDNWSPGSRLPALMMCASGVPGCTSTSLELTYSVDSVRNNNALIYTTPLALFRWYDVAISVDTVSGVLGIAVVAQTGSDSMATKTTSISGRTQSTWSNVAVYASDPWTAAAGVNIGNLVIYQGPQASNPCGGTCNAGSALTPDCGFCRYCPAGTASQNIEYMQGGCPLCPAGMLPSSPASGLSADSKTGNTACSYFRSANPPPPSPPPPLPTANPVRPPPTFSSLSLPATFFPRTDGKGTPLSARTLLGTIGSLPSRYLMTFTMLINSDGSSWRNVIHLSANNQDNWSPGSRLPALMMCASGVPGCTSTSLELTYSVDSVRNNNALIYTTPLALFRWYDVAISVDTVSGVLGIAVVAQTGSDSMATKTTSISGRTQSTWSNVAVYASDPWTAAAGVNIGNLVIYQGPQASDPCPGWTECRAGYATAPDDCSQCRTCPGGTASQGSTNTYMQGGCLLCPAGMLPSSPASGLSAGSVYGNTACSSFRSANPPPPPPPPPPNPPPPPPTPPPVGDILTSLPSTAATLAPTATPAPTAVPCPGGSYLVNDTNCQPCPLGFISSNQATTCDVCPAGGTCLTPMSAQAKFCPQGFFSTGPPPDFKFDPKCDYTLSPSSQTDSKCLLPPEVTKCTACPQGQVTPGTGSTSAAVCLSPAPNFVFGFFALLLSVALVVLYLNYGRFREVAFLRRKRVTDPQTVEYSRAFESLTEYERFIISASKIKQVKKLYELFKEGKETSHSSWKEIIRFLTFIVLSFFALNLLAASYFVGEIASILFKALIIWKRLKDVAFFKIILAYSAILAVLLERIYVVLRQWAYPLVQLVSALFRPLLWLFDVLASIHIENIFKQLNVTCQGSTAPIELVLNLCVLGFVVVVIESRYQIFRGIIFKTVTSKFNATVISPEYFRARFKDEESGAGKYLFLLTHFFFLLVCACVQAVGEFLNFQSALSFTVSFVKISNFISDKGFHSFTPACNQIPYAINVDSFLAKMTTLVALMALQPALYEISNVLCPGLPKFVLSTIGSRQQRSEARTASTYKETGYTEIDSLLKDIQGLYEKELTLRHKHRPGDAKRPPTKEDEEKLKEAIRSNVETYMKELASFEYASREDPRLAGHFRNEVTRLFLLRDSPGPGRKLQALSKTRINNIQEDMRLFRTFYQYYEHCKNRLLNVEHVQDSLIDFEDRPLPKITPELKVAELRKVKDDLGAELQLLQDHRQEVVTKQAGSGVVSVNNNEAFFWIRVPPTLLAPDIILSRLSSSWVDTMRSSIGKHSKLKSDITNILLAIFPVRVEEIKAEISAIYKIVAPELSLDPITFERHHRGKEEGLLSDIRKRYKDVLPILLEVCAIYAVVAPNNLPLNPHMLEDYKGKEAQLLLDIRAKYANAPAKKDGGYEVEYDWGEDEIEEHRKELESMPEERAKMLVMLGVNFNSLYFSSSNAPNRAFLNRGEHAGHKEQDADYTKRLNKIKKELKSLPVYRRLDEAGKFVSQGRERLSSCSSWGRTASINAQAPSRSEHDLLAEDDFGGESWKGSLPTYWKLCMLECEELGLPTDEPIVIFAVAPLFSILPIGHLCTQVGRTFWLVVIVKYMTFFLTALGVWTLFACEAYDVENEMLQFGKRISYPKEDSRSKGDENEKYSSFLEATIAPRAILLQLVPQLAIFSIYAAGTASCPIFFSKRFSPEFGIKFVDKLYPLLEQKPFTSAKQAEDPRHKDQKWIQWLRGLYSAVIESRLIQFAFHLYKVCLSVAVLYYPTHYGLVASAIALLMPFCYVRSLLSVVYLGKVMGISDPHFSFGFFGSAKHIEEEKDIKQMIKFNINVETIASQLVAAMFAATDDDDKTALNKQQKSSLVNNIIEARRLMGDLGLTSKEKDIELEGCIKGVADVPQAVENLIERLTEQLNAKRERKKADGQKSFAAQAFSALGLGGGGRRGSLDEEAEGRYEVEMGNVYGRQNSWTGNPKGGSDYHRDSIGSYSYNSNRDSIGSYYSTRDSHSRSSWHDTMDRHSASFRPSHSSLSSTGAAHSLESSISNLYGPQRGGLRLSGRDAALNASIRLSRGIHANTATSNNTSANALRSPFQLPMQPPQGGMQLPCPPLRSSARQTAPAVVTQTQLPSPRLSGRRFDAPRTSRIVLATSPPPPLQPHASL